MFKVKPKDGSDVLKFPVREHFWMTEQEELCVNI